MNVDDEGKDASGSNQATGVSTPAVEGPVQDASNKGKETSVKKVFSLSFISFFSCLTFLFQTLEKRPEVILLEYYEVPGITIDDNFLFAQKLVSNAKRIKTEHLAMANGVFIIQFNYPLCLIILVFRRGWFPSYWQS
jgi:hypothetical protein